MIPKEIRDLLVEFSRSTLFKIFILGVFFIMGTTAILIFNFPVDNLEGKVIKTETDINFDFKSNIGEK